MTRMHSSIGAVDRRRHSSKSYEYTLDVYRPRDFRLFGAIFALVYIAELPEPGDGYLLNGDLFFSLFLSYFQSRSDDHPDLLASFSPYLVYTY